MAESEDGWTERTSIPPVGVIVPQSLFAGGLLALMILTGLAGLGSVVAALVFMAVRLAANAWRRWGLQSATWISEWLRPACWILAAAVVAHDGVFQSYIGTAATVSAAVAVTGMEMRLTAWTWTCIRARALHRSVGLLLITIGILAFLLYNRVLRDVHESAPAILTAGAGILLVPLVVRGIVREVGPLLTMETRFHGIRDTLWVWVFLVLFAVVAHIGLGLAPLSAGEYVSAQIAVLLLVFVAGVIGIQSAVGQALSEQTPAVQPAIRRHGQAIESVQSPAVDDWQGALGESFVGHNDSMPAKILIQALEEDDEVRSALGEALEESPIRVYPLIPFWGPYIVFILQAALLGLAAGFLAQEEGWPPLAVGLGVLGVVLVITQVASVGAPPWAPAVMGWVGAMSIWSSIAWIIGEWRLWESRDLFVIVGPLMLAPLHHLTSRRSRISYTLKASPGDVESRLREYQTSIRRSLMVRLAIIAALGLGVMVLGLAGLMDSLPPIGRLLWPLAAAVLASPAIRWMVSSLHKKRLITLEKGHQTARLRTVQEALATVRGQETR